MSASHDDPDVGSTHDDMDDAMIEAMLRGDSVPRELEPLATAIGAMRAACVTYAKPSPELAERMARADFPRARRPYRRSAIGRAMRTITRMSVRAKAASLVAIGLTGVSGVAAAGALPDAAQERVESVVESVTPFEFSDKADFGQDVADDARDGGVDGQEIAEKAKDKSNGVDPTQRPTTTPPVTLPDVVPTNPPHDTPRDAPRERPSATPPVVPPRDDKADDHPNSQPDPTPPASDPDNANNDRAGDPAG